MGAVAPTCCTPTSPVTQLPAPSTPVQQLPTPPASTMAPALQQALQDLRTITGKLNALLQSLSGVQQLQPAPTLPQQQQTPQSPPQTLPTAPPVPTTLPTTATTASPLAGFGGTGDAGERAQLGAALTKMGGSRVGTSLLASIRNKGVNLDIVSDAEFNQRSKGATDAIGVFIAGANTPPTVLVRASALTGGDQTKLIHILAHELTHAAQYVSGESQRGYGAVASTAGMTQPQIAIASTLMAEAGASFVATAVQAELSDPARFRERAAANLPAAYGAGWEAANSSGYNPTGAVVRQAVSPTAWALVQQGLAAA